MRKVGNIIGLLGLVVIAVFTVRSIGLNTVENLRLVTGGTVTQGIILSVGSCSGGRYTPSTPMYVQFTDTQGRQQVATAEEGCGYIGIPFRQNGDHVTIVYLQDDPTLARIQGDLVLQLILELPGFLILLFILYALGRFWLKRIRGAREGRPG